MNKTKIIATIGPSTYNNETIKDLIDAGVDVIRLNMHYATHEFAEKVINEVHQINDGLRYCIGTMIDLEGLCIRTGNFSGGKAYYKTGDRIRMYTKETICNDVQFSVNYQDILDDLKYRSTIKLNNGKVILEVVEKGLDYAVLEVKEGGEVYSNSKVYLPEIKIHKNHLTKKDKEDIIFASKMNVDYIAISNVQDQEDILEVNDLLIELGNDHTYLLAKVENGIVTENLDKVIEISDGIILSRCDIDIVVPMEEVPNIKNSIIKKCHQNGKMSIITAELTSFMNGEIVPTHSEVSDIANSVSHCVDAIMLTAETSVGKHPVEAVQEIEKVLKVAESTIDYEYYIDAALKTKTTKISNTIVSSVALGAIELDCKAIIVATNSGYTARQMSKLKPPCIIIAATPDMKVARGLNLYFGVIPVIVDELNFHELSYKSIKITQKLLNLKQGDKIITTGGYPFREIKHTNFMKIDEI